MYSLAFLLTLQLKCRFCLLFKHSHDIGMGIVGWLETSGLKWPTLGSKSEQEKLGSECCNKQKQSEQSKNDGKDQESI